MTSYIPIIRRRWLTVDMTPQQLTQCLRDLNITPPDARFHSLALVGNPADGQKLVLTYESDELPFTDWDGRERILLTYPTDPNIDSNDDTQDSWEVLER